MERIAIIYTETIGRTNNSGRQIALVEIKASTASSDIDRKLRNETGNEHTCIVARKSSAN